MLGLMIRDGLSKWQDRFPLLLDGVSMDFSPAPSGIKASTGTFCTLFEPYENSWVIMVTLRPAGTSATKETSLQTSEHLLQTRIPTHDNTAYAKSTKRIILMAVI